MAVRTAVSPHGYTYQVVPAPGGVWHVWPNGQRTFVPAKPPAPKPPAAPSPAAPVSQPQAVQTYEQSPGELSPDAEYYTGAAQREFQRQQNLAANQAQGSTNVQTRDRALQQMGVQQPLDERQTQVNANRSGLYYSTTLGNQLGALAATYAQRRTQAQQSYDAAEQARVAARTAIEQGYSLDDAAARAAAADRQIQRDQSAADAGALVAATPQIAAQSVQLARPKAVPKPKLVKPKAPARPRVVVPRVVARRAQPVTVVRKPRRR